MAAILGLNNKTAPKEKPQTINLILFILRFSKYSRKIRMEILIKGIANSSTRFPPSKNKNNVVADNNTANIDKIQFAFSLAILNKMKSVENSDTNSIYHNPEWNDKDCPI